MPQKGQAQLTESVASGEVIVPRIIFGNRYILWDYKENRLRAVGNTIEEIRKAIEPTESEKALERKKEQIFQDKRHIKKVNALTNLFYAVAEIPKKITECINAVKKWFPIPDSQ